MNKDKQWSLDTRDLFSGKCYFAGMREGCMGIADHAHHIIPRRYRETRHAKLNGVALCHVCHAYLHDVDMSILEEDINERFPEWGDWIRKTRYNVLSNRLGSKTEWL